MPSKIYSLPKNRHYACVMYRTKRKILSLALKKTERRLMTGTVLHCTTPDAKCQEIEEQLSRELDAIFHPHFFNLRYVYALNSIPCSVLLPLRSYNRPTYVGHFFLQACPLALENSSSMSRNDSSNCTPDGNDSRIPQRTPADDEVK